MALGFASVMLAHILLIFAVYWTFKQFGRSKVKDPSLQVEVKEESYSMPKLMIFCLIVFIVFIFTRGLMVLDQMKILTLSRTKALILLPWRE